MAQDWNQRAKSKHYSLMRKLLLNILLFVIILLVPLCVADYIKTKEYRSKDFYPFSTWNDIVDGKLNSDTWILGSSRAWVQYNPRILDSILDISSYNLGGNAQFLFLNLQSCEIARAYNPKPKYILLDLFYSSLTMEEAPVSRYVYMPYIFKHKLRRIITHNQAIDPFYFYLPYYRYYFEKGNEIWFVNEIGGYKGFLSKDLKWDDYNLSSIDTVHYKKESAAINLLNDFITDCKKDTISIIMIHSPFYREGFEKIHGHQEMMTMFQNIANQNNIPFLDYTNDPICYDTAYFYNAMHLNARGANLFTEKLAHDLDSLNLIPARK